MRDLGSTWKNSLALMKVASSLDLSRAGERSRRSDDDDDDDEDESPFKWSSKTTKLCDG